MSNKLRIDLSSHAYAFQLVRMDEKKNEFVYYEALTFPKDPFTGIEVNLRRARICGSLFAKGSSFCVDILDESGDIIQDFQVEKKAFDYLKRKFRLRVECA